MNLERLPGKIAAQKVRDTVWVKDARPWIDYPWKKAAMHSTAELAYLYHIGKTITGDMVNLGTYKGMSTAALAYGIRDSKIPGMVYTVDLFNHGENTAKEIIEDAFRSVSLEKYITCCEGTTHEWAEKLKDKRFGFVFIDADHNYDFVKKDFELWSLLLKLHGVVAFHDVDFNTVDRVINEMDDSWELANHVGKIKAFKKRK